MSMERILAGSDIFVGRVADNSICPNLNRCIVHPINLQQIYIYLFIWLVEKQNMAKYPTLDIGYLYYQKYPKYFIHKLYDLVRTENILHKFEVVFIGNELVRSCMLDLAAQIEFGDKPVEEIKLLFQEIEIINMEQKQSFLDMNYEIVFVVQLESHMMELRSSKLDATAKSPPTLLHRASQFRPFIWRKGLQNLLEEKEKEPLLKTVKVTKGRGGNSSHKIILKIYLLTKSHNHIQRWFDYVLPDLSKLAAFIVFSNNKIVVNEN